MEGNLCAWYRGLLALLASFVLVAGCADEKDPAYLAGLLDDPVETENAIEKLRKMVDERLQIQEPKAKTASAADFAARTTGQLVTSFKNAVGNPLVRSRILSILTRSVPFTKDPTAVVDGVFFPILEEFKSKGEDPAQASLVVDTIASLAAPAEGTTAALSETQIGAAAALFRDVAKAVRDTWKCQERQDRMQGKENPVADQEQLILSCIQGVANLVSSPKGKAALGSGVSVLADSLRESFFFQDFFLNRAAADAANDIAGVLEPESVREIAPALVEGLFLEGDFFLFPYARRALVHIAAASAENREIVATELLRALNVDMPASIASALPAVAAAGKNDSLELLALPCGTSLSVSCGQKRDSLRAYVTMGMSPGEASCNQRVDPDRPGSGFQWGFSYGVFWDKVGNMLVDIVAPMQPGAMPDTTSKTGLAIEVLRLQVEQTAQWVEQIKADKELHGKIAEVYRDFMQASAPGVAPEAAPAAPTAPPRPPTISDAIQPLFDTLTGLRAQGSATLSPDVRNAAAALAAALLSPDATSGDRDASEDLLKGIFTDLQNELLALADFDHDYSDVNLRLWRTVAAVRTLSMLGASGRDDATVRDALRMTQFALENLRGFPVTAIKSFPMLVLRHKQRFTPEGQPRLGQPAIPAFIDAIQNFQRPIPEVMNFLLQMIAANALTEGNRNATIRDEKYLIINADVATFRAQATRAFFMVFRRDAAAPRADDYLKNFDFFTRDVQYVLALEKTEENEAAFRMYPPNVPPAPGEAPPTGEEPQVDWLATPPDPSGLFTFDAYRDRLATCVLREREDKGDLARWKRGMSDDEKTGYCRKWVEPFASEGQSGTPGADIAKMEIADWHCWFHMKTLHDDRVQYCLDKEKERTPEKELNLSAEQCKEIMELDDTYAYCLDLRLLPEYVEAGKPTLWGCYDRFPWLRSWEPIGPESSHIAQRILAAYVYVKFRSEAGVPAADGVSYDSLKAVMPLDEYLLFAKTFGIDQSVELFAKVDRLTQELAKVKGDYPVFARPTDEIDRVAKTSVRKPDGARMQEFVTIPWYWHPEWVQRQPIDFSDIRATFLESCRAEGDETGLECARDGGKLGNQMKIMIEGGSPGPLRLHAHSLAIMLAGQDLVTMGELRDAVDAVEQACYRGGNNYDFECLSKAALEGSGREATLLVNPGCRGMAVDALACTPDPEWDPGPNNDPEPCTQRKQEYALSACAKFITDPALARGVTTAELYRRVRALYLLSAMAAVKRDIAESVVSDMLIAVDSDPRFLPPVTFAVQKIRPQCCPAGQEGPCDRIGCERVRLFSEYWRSQPVHEPQAPDIDALYYMLLASR